MYKSATACVLIATVAAPLGLFAQPPTTWRKIGNDLIDLSLAWGLTPFGVVSSDAKAKFAYDLGARHVPEPGFVEVREVHHHSELGAPADERLAGVRDRDGQR